MRCVFNSKATLRLIERGMPCKAGGMLPLELNYY